MAVKFTVRVFAFAACDTCGKDGPAAMVGYDHDLSSAFVALNSTRPADLPVVGERGEWYCASCKTPAVEPRR